MPLPKRPGPYLLASLLILLAALAVWMFSPVPLPEVRQVPMQKAETARSETSDRTRSRGLEPVFIDPVLQAQANLLNAPDRTARDDLHIVAEFIETYRKALGSNPIGQNEDITAALTGNFGQKGRVFPPNSPVIREGQLVDRWGTPYWFHPESGTKMEIRSAGPDKDLFTADDVILNP